MIQIRRWLIPSYVAILTLTALLTGLLLRGPMMFAADGDGARHIRLGQSILELGAVPKYDIFSHTRDGTPIVLHEWLSEVTLALADAAAGLPGVAVLAGLLYTAAVVAVYWAAVGLGALRPLALLSGVLALLLQSIHLLPRPHLFTTAFAGFFLVVLIRHARTGHDRTLAVLPLLMLIWANTHGGFLLGITLLGAFLIGALLRSSEFVDGRQSAKPLAIALAACLTVTLLTPAGVRLWIYTLGHLGADRFLIAITQEFQSVDFQQAYAKLFFLTLFAGPALWMTGRVRVSWLGAGLYLFFAASALHSARNIPLFGLIVLPWLPLWIEEALSGEASAAVLARLRRMDRADRTLRPGLWILVAAGVVAFALGHGSSRYRFDPRVFPVEALGHLDRLDTEGPVFNQLHWGGYLLYARPGLPVFIDGQTDFYGEALSRQYLAALRGRPRWREVLEEHEITWTLLERDEPLNQLLALANDWQLAYADDVAAIYRREEPSDER